MEKTNEDPAKSKLRVRWVCLSSIHTLSRLLWSAREWVEWREWFWSWVIAAWSLRLWSALSRWSMPRQLSAHSHGLCELPYPQVDTQWCLPYLANRYPGMCEYRIQPIDTQGCHEPWLFTVSAGFAESLPAMIESMREKDELEYGSWGGWLSITVGLWDYGSWRWSSIDYDSLMRLPYRPITVVRSGID